MAALRWSVNSGDVQLAANTPLTVLQVAAPANQRVKIETASLFLEGQVTTDPMVLVQFLRQTAGSGTGSTAKTPVKLRSSDPEAVQAAVHVAYATEPTSAVNGQIGAQRLHPQTGEIRDFIIDKEIEVIGGEVLGIVLTASTAVKCMIELVGEE